MFDSFDFCFQCQPINYRPAQLFDESAVAIDFNTNFICMREIANKIFLNKENSSKILDLGILINLKFLGLFYEKRTVKDKTFSTQRSEK